MTITLDGLKYEDVHPLARIHRSAFPGFFLSTLGEPFLVEFYRGFLTDDSAVCVVARGAGGVVHGAVVGTTEPDLFFGRLVRRRWPRFVLASVTAVLRHPGTAPRLIRALRYRGDAPPNSTGALLCSVCVDPSMQGAGVGHELVEAWTRAAAARGARTAFLTTDARDNDAVNRFYRQRGWQVSHRYATREGRQMNRYTTSLDAR